MSDMSKEFTHVVRAKREIQKRLVRVGSTDFYFFRSAVKAYILDGVYGDIYSVTLGGGKLVVKGNTLVLIRGSESFEILDAAKLLYDFDFLTECECIRGERQAYKYITISILGVPVKLYSHHLMAICIYGDDAFDPNIVVDHVSQVNKLDNRFCNLELVSPQGNRIRYWVNRRIVKGGVA